MKDFKNKFIEIGYKHKNDDVNYSKNNKNKSNEDPIKSH
jgi:hypothetical protein